MRANGVGWVPSLRGRPLTDASDLFREVSPQQFRDIMLGSHFVSGWSSPNRPDYALRHSSSLVPAELSADKQDALKLSFEDYLASLAELNAQLVDGRYFRNNDAFILDATTDMAIQAIAPKGTLILECDEPIASVEATSISAFSQEPWGRSQKLLATANSSRAEIDLSSVGPLQDSELRRTITVKIKTQSTSIINRVTLVSALPEDRSVAE